MKKLLGIFMVVTLALFGCSQGEKKEQDTIKIGLVTDSGSIDDKSFNQGTWEGVLQFQENQENVEVQYIQPSEETLQDYMNAIDNLVMVGNKVIVLPGFKFEETADQAAKTYEDVKFILIDGQPSDNGEYVTHDNVVSIYFTEHEAGFMAGVASALETKTDKLGFIGGFDVHSVYKFGLGYLTGVAYANQELGTNAQVADYIYVGSFTDVDAGKAISGAMFDKGIDIIQHAAGGVGVGAISEAKTRVEAGEDVKIVGVDVDQFNEGIISNGESIILTSAMKRLSVAVNAHLEYWLNDEFKGGEVITMNITDDAVGLPTNNPNLSANTCNTLEEVKQLLKDGTIKVPSTKEDTKDFLDKYNYDYSGLEF